MRHLNASMTSRFFSYWLDYFIIGIVANPVITLITDNIGASNELFLSKYELLMESLLSQNIDFVLFKQVLILALIILGVNFVIYLLLVLIYMCIIPMFWSKQTVGRFLFNVRVVKEKDEGKCGFFRLCLREIFGGLIVTVGLVQTFIIPIIILIWIVSKYGRSFSDYIASTRLISLKEEVYYQESNVHDYSSVIDAQYYEYDDRKKDKSSDEDDYKII